MVFPPLAADEATRAGRPERHNAQISVVGSESLNPERTRADQPLVLKYYKHDPTSLGSRADPAKPAFSV
jgi:hypothetical protein